MSVVNGEIKFGPIVTTHEVSNPVTVTREQDICTREEVLRVEVRLARSVHGRRIKYFLDEFDELEVRILANQMRLFIEADIQ